MSILYLGTSTTIQGSQVAFNNSEVTLNKIPESSYDVTNKVYVDNRVDSQKTRIDAILEGASISLDTLIELTNYFNSLSGEDLNLITNLTSNIGAEVTRAQAAEAVLTANLADEVTRAQSSVAVLVASIDSEVSRAQGAEGVLTANLNAEVTRAQGAEGVITANINAEVSRAQQVEGVITGNLNIEVGRAQQAESDITANLNAEISRAQGVESMFETRLDAIYQYFFRTNSSVIPV